MRSTLTYMVCATPRCGSTLLDEALSRTGIAGNPEEYFFRPNRCVWGEAWHAPTFTEYLAEVFRHGTTPNGVFGVKMMWGYFAEFSHLMYRLPETHGKTLPEALKTIFPELSYIWIIRRDKVRQAVSHARARQTNVWAVTSESQPRAQNKPIFSFQQIDFMVRELEMHDSGWLHYFSVHGIRPYVVFYEDFVQQYEETARNIISYLQIALPEHLSFQPRRLLKQADTESEEWVQRYSELKRRKTFVGVSTELATFFMPRFDLSHVEKLVAYRE